MALPDIADSATSELRTGDAATIPAVHAEHCVHSLCEQASCIACVVACPADAWSLDDEQLSIDTTRCDACGLCVSACPQDALELPLSPLHANLADQLVVLIACDRSVAADSLGGVIPCVHALGIRGMARLAAVRISAVIYTTDNCATCPRSGVQSLESDLLRINSLLDSRNQPRLKHARVSQRDWLALRARDPATTARSPARRRFLLDSLAQLANLGKALEIPVPRPPQSASSLLAAPGTGLAEWSPDLDATRCNGCNACIRLCPTGALQNQHDQNVYEVTPDACTGCQLCCDVCRVGAIKVVPLGSAKPYRIALDQRRCSACGVSFHLPSEQGCAEKKCPICREINHYRRLYQVLD